MENTLYSAPLFYPSAREWMWTYCIYLGPFTDSTGKNYDLGIFIRGNGKISNAIVYGHEEGNYISGDINNVCKLEHYQETYKRAKALNLIS